MDDLFVFGYGCKLFRDDERAMYIDNGRHLIPWMGDERLMIDRYDGRGHLHDLSKHDAENVKVDPWGPTESVKAMEAACDHERYLELHVDMTEQAIYEEEEWKRYYASLGGDGGFNAMGFSYDYNPNGSGDMVPQSYVPEEELFVPAPELNVPNNMPIPQTDKENARIEKTASFIAEHGAQMEIMIKAKQRDNPQFEFMEHDHPVNSYFKHMVKMIKSGKYKPVVEPKPQALDRQNSSYEEEDDDSHGYLHPSLMSSTSTTVVSKPVPKPVVRVHETPYGDLIKSVTKSLRDTAQQKQERASLTPPPLPPFMAQDVYGPSQKTTPAPPGLEPVTLPEGHSDLQGNGETKKHREVSTGPQIVPPAPDIQPIIDRMALYVAKNGVDFETVVKSKKDARFDFLHTWHPHYAYYNFRKQLHLEELEQEKSEDDDSKNQNKGVSFKLKMKELEPTSLEKRKAFDYESSDDEQTDEGVEGKEKAPVEDAVEQSSVQTIKPTPQITKEMEKKIAEDKVKDRLALAAREKLAQTSKDKQVKAERKRKAAMFINLLKSGTGGGAAGEDKSENGTDSRSNSRPGTPHNLLSGKTSPAADDISPVPLVLLEDHMIYPPARSSPLPKAYYGIPSSMRRQRSPTPPSAYSGRHRSRSPRRFSRIPSPAKHWSNRKRSRSPRRLDRRNSPTRSTANRRSRSPTYSHHTQKLKRSRSKSPKSRRSPSKTKSKKKKHRKSRSRSRSRSPSKKSKSKGSGHSDKKSSSKSDSMNRKSSSDQNGANSHHRPSRDDKVKLSRTEDHAADIKPKLPHVSHEKTSKVRAMLKEKRKAIMKEQEVVELDL